MVEDEFPWVRLIASSENLGFGAAVNAVAARTRTPWVAPANADVRVETGALQTLLAEGARYPQAAVLAPRLILSSGETQHSVYPFPTVPFTLAYATGAVTMSRRLASYWCIDRGFDPEQAREVCWAVGAFLLVRREAWEAVGGFDATQWMYAEDLDLGWRLARAGWHARFVPHARVSHEESAATTKAWGADRYARSHASTYAWMARRRGIAITRLVAAIQVTSFLIRAAALSPAAMLGAGASRQARQRMLEGARAHAVGLRRRSEVTREARPI
jgi:N-acetylglucosaminyl-diphospho-decaprenol L-rhamnosyltransferase